MTLPQWSLEREAARTLLPLLGNPDWGGGVLSHLECSLARNPGIPAIAVVRKPQRWEFTVNADWVSRPERWIHQVGNYTQYWDLKLCPSTSEHRELTTPTSTFESTALKCGKITEFQGLTFSFDLVLLLPFSDRKRLKRPDKNITLTSCDGVPSLGYNSMILKLFKLFIQTKRLKHIKS